MTAFLRGLSNHLKSYNIAINDEDEKNLAYILDSSNSGYVTSFRVSEFLKGFGPLKRAITYVRIPHQPSNFALIDLLNRCDKLWPRSGSMASSLAKKLRAC